MRGNVVIKKCEALVQQQPKRRWNHREGRGIGEKEFEGVCSKTRTPRIGTQVKEQDASDLIGTSKLQPYHFCADESFEVFSVFLHLCNHKRSFLRLFTLKARRANSMLSNAKLARLRKLLLMGGRRLQLVMVSKSIKTKHKKTNTHTILSNFLIQ